MDVFALEKEPPIAKVYTITEDTVDDSDSLCQLIDSWTLCPNKMFIPHPNPIAEGERRKTADELFEIATVIARRIRVKNMAERKRAYAESAHIFEKDTIQGQGFVNMISNIPSLRFDTKESRNGCEIWQAFLIVAHFGHQHLEHYIHHVDRSDPYKSSMLTYCGYVKTASLACGYECFRRRIQQTPQWAETTMSIETAIQMIMILPVNNIAAIADGKTALSHVIRRYSNSYDSLRKVKALLEHAIQLQAFGGHWVSNNSNILQLAVRAITQRLIEMYQRRRAAGLSQQIAPFLTPSREIHNSTTHSSTSPMQTLSSELIENIMQHSENGWYTTKPLIHFN